MATFKKTTLLVCATLFFLALCGMASAATYSINNTNDFDQYMYNPALISDSNNIFILNCDIVFTAGNSVPIGDNTTPFKGTFYGNNHTISNFSLNTTTQSNLGLFGKTDGAKIYDLVLKNFSINATNSTSAPDVTGN